jgi:hypothetical protein
VSRSPLPPVRWRSEGAIDHAVEVSAKGIGAEGWEPRPAAFELAGWQRTPAEWPKLCHRPPISSHGHPFAGDDPVDHVTTLVAQFPDRYFAHSSRVSRVIHPLQGLPSAPVQARRSALASSAEKAAEQVLEPTPAGAAPEEAAEEVADAATAR